MRRLLLLFVFLPVAVMAQQIPEQPCPSAEFSYVVKDCNKVLLEFSKTKNIKSVQWFFGDGAGSNQLSPTHEYKKYGPYKIKAIVTGTAGCADTVTKDVKLTEFETDFTFSTPEERNKFLFKAINDNAAYSWDFGDGEIIKDQAAVAHKYKQDGTYTIRLFAKNNAGCTDTVEKIIGILLPKKALPDLVIINGPEMAGPSKQVQLEKREKDLIRNIVVEHDSVTISLYDNGMVDGDSVTLIYNNNIILSHQLLKADPVVLRLKVDPAKSSNELAMYAENLGTIPPNTALMVITDGDKRYEVTVSSTKTSNGVISFTVKNSIRSQ